MKRVLIISYYWPPTSSSGVQRWVKFCKYLPSMGWQPVVYTPENPERLATDWSLMEDIPPEAEILKTQILEPYDIYRKLSGRKAGVSSGEINPLNARKKCITQRLFVLIRGNFFIPDPRRGWVRPSIRFLLRYLKQHPVDVVVTTGPPHSIHLIGRGLKRELGVKWVADFRDPWTEIFYFKHLGLWPWAEHRHRDLEFSVLNECDAVICVSPLVRDDFQAHTSRPVHLVTNGYDEDDFPLPSSDISENAAGEFFTITHTGLFAADGNPLVLWDVLAEVCASDIAFKKALRLCLVGKVDPEIVSAIRERGLGDNLELTGYLPHNLAVEQQRKSDLLILPLRQEPEYRKVLPGKIFEYMASGRTVLGIGQEDSIAATVLRESGAGEFFDWDNTAGIAAFISRVTEAFGRGERLTRATDCKKYTRSVLTAELVKILEELPPTASNRT